MSHLVEQKLKKLHYFPPNFRVQPPHSILAAHPLLASLPKKAFRTEVSHPACACCKPALHTPHPPSVHWLRWQGTGACRPTATWRPTRCRPASLRRPSARRSATRPMPHASLSCPPLSIARRLTLQTPPYAPAEAATPRCSRPTAWRYASSADIALRGQQ